MKTETIARCWIKSKALPITMETQMSVAYGRIKSCSDHENVEEMTKMMDNLSGSMDRRDPFYAKTRETVTVSDVEK